MNSVRALLVSLLAGLLLVLPGAFPLTAHADEENPDWRITRWTTNASFTTNGTGQVTTDLDFDFGSDDGHGPYLTFPIRHTIPGDPDHYRAIDIRDVTVTSPSGAPAQVVQEIDGGVLTLRIGSPGRSVRGVQSYQIRYRLHGVADPRNAISGLDELNWTVLGDGFTLPVQNVTVNLDLPADSTRVACFVGAGRDEEPCRTATDSGRSASFSHPQLPAGTSPTRRPRRCSTA